MLLEALLVLVAAAYLHVYLSRRRANLLTRGIPELSGLSLLSNFYALTRIKTFGDFWKLAMARTTEEAGGGGRILKSWLGSALCILVWEPAYIQEVANSTSMVNKGEAYKHLFGGEGIFSSSGGQEWKDLRKPLTKTLEKKSLDGKYLDIFQKQTEDFISFLLEKRTGRTIDIREDISGLLINIFSETHLGVVLNEAREKKWTFFKYIDLIHDVSWRLMWKQVAILSIFSNFARANLKTKLKDYKEKANSFLEWILNERRKSFGKTKGNPENLTDFILLKGEEKHISQKTMRSQLCDYIIAGSETTSLLVSSTLLFLAMYPDCQDRVLEEQTEILKSGDGGGDPQLGRMDYLGRVISEALRLVSPPLVIKKCEEDTRVGDYVFPRDSYVLLFLQRCQRDPSYWSRPHSFRPDHFLTEEVDGRPRFSYLPFGVGPRACPGFQYGINAAKVILSRIIRRFKITTHLKFEDIIWNFKMFVEVDNGYLMKFEER